MQTPQSLDSERPERGRPLQSPVTVLALIPLLLGLLTVPWFGVVGVVAWYNIGDQPPNQTQSFFINAICFAPAIVGLFAGISLFVDKRIEGLLGRVSAGVGSVICAILTCVYVWGLIHWLIQVL